MNATASCFAVIFVHFLTRDAKIPLHRAIGVLISGAYVLLRPELDGGISSRGLGETAGLCAAVPLALAGIFGKRFHDQLPVVTATGMFTCSSLVMLPLVVIVDRPWTLDISMSSMTPVAGLVLFSSVLVQLRAYVFAVLQHSELCRCYQPAPGYSTDGRLCTCAWSAFLAEPVYASPAVGMAFVVAGLMIIDGRVLRRLRSSKGDMLDEGLARGLDVARGR